MTIRELSQITAIDPDTYINVSTWLSEYDLVTTDTGNTEWGDVPERFIDLEIKRITIGDTKWGTLVDIELKEVNYQ